MLLAGDGLPRLVGRPGKKQRERHDGDDDGRDERRPPADCAKRDDGRNDGERDPRTPQRETAKEALGKRRPALSANVRATGDEPQTCADPDQ